MIHLIRIRSRSCQSSIRRGHQHPRHCRLLLVLPIVGAFLSLASCSDESPPPKSPPLPVTDTRPVGEGLKVIGFALLGGTVVLVLGRLIR